MNSSAPPINLHHHKSKHSCLHLQFRMSFARRSTDEAGRALSYNARHAVIGFTGSNAKIRSISCGAFHRQLDRRALFRLRDNAVHAFRFLCPIWLRFLYVYAREFSLSAQSSGWSARVRKISRNCAMRASWRIFEGKKEVCVAAAVNDLCE